MARRRQATRTEGFQASRDLSARRPYLGLTSPVHTARMQLRGRLFSDLADMRSRSGVGSPPRARFAGATLAKAEARTRTACPARAGRREHREDRSLSRGPA